MIIRSTSIVHCGYYVFESNCSIQCAQVVKFTSRTGQVDFSLLQQSLRIEHLASSWYAEMEEKAILWRKHGLENKSPIMWTERSFFADSPFADSLATQWNKNLLQSTLVVQTTKVPFLHTLVTIRCESDTHRLPDCKSTDYAIQILWRHRESRSQHRCRLRDVSWFPPQR